MANNSTGVYTFYPKFSDFVTLYRGAVGAWIGDGTPLDVEGKKGGFAGCIYVSYITGEYQELGFVSDYEKLKAYFAEIGIELSYEDYVTMLANMPDEVRLSEAWARGTEDSEPVSPTHITYHNNSKYYSEQSAGSASAASISETNAANSASAASTSETNAHNSELAAAESARLAGLAKDDAVGAKNDAISAKNDSETARDASISAKNDSVTAKNASETARDAAQGYSNSAATSATNASSSASAAHTSEVNAKTSEDNASASATTASQKADSIKGATITVAYHNSSNGTTPPSGNDWTNVPDPVQGEFIWTRMIFNWNDGTTSTKYDVTYVGMDGVGAVTRVNGKTGNVVLYAGDITMSSLDSDTISERLETATVAEIDALFD